MTDYNQAARIIKKVPTWEREYRLETVTEAMMARKQSFLSKYLLTNTQNLLHYVNYVTDHGNGSNQPV